MIVAIVIGLFIGVFVGLPLLVFISSAWDAIPILLGILAIETILLMILEPWLKKHKWM